jgi:hypothetical protein
MRKTFNSPFPFYLNNELGNSLLCLAISIFTIGFLIVFQPFPELNAHNTFKDNLIITAALLLTLLFNVILIPRLFPALFDITNWNLKKYILFNVWLLGIVGLCLGLVSFFILGYCSSIFLSLSTTLMQVIAIGIIPLFFVTFVIKNRMLTENLKSALAANDNIQEIIQQTSGEENSQRIHIYTDTNETLSLMRHDFIFAEAQDNYCLIHFKETEKPQQKLLRLTLKNLESQLANRILIRCHKSYLINIMFISSISGNSNGYKLHISGTELQIPVSRTKGKEIIAQIELLKDTLAII